MHQLKKIGQRGVLKIYSKVLVILAILTISFNSSVEAKEKRPLAVSEKTVESSFVVPFDINAEKLPSNYRGTDIAKLYSFLAKKAPLRKKEFETTADYEKKIKSVLSDNVYAFMLDFSSRVGTRFGVSGYLDYNADAQKLKIIIKPDYMYMNNYPREVSPRTTVIVKEIDKRTRSYIGSNVFGVNRLVKGYSSTQYLVALVNSEMVSSDLNCEVDILPDKAKNLINNIGVLLLCKMSLHEKPSLVVTGNDLIFEDSYSVEATISFPASHFFDRKYINVEALAMWVYNLRTGEIIFKKELR
jgi:hypothetical protein